MITLKQRYEPLFQHRITTTDPKVVIRYEQRGQMVYREDVIKGIFSLVFPKNGQEHAFLKPLCHGVDKFAPANGGGILVRTYLLPAK